MSMNIFFSLYFFLEFENDFTHGKNRYISPFVEFLFKIMLLKLYNGRQSICRSSGDSHDDFRNNCDNVMHNLLSFAGSKFGNSMSANNSFTNFI